MFHIQLTCGDASPLQKSQKLIPTYYYAKANNLTYEYK